MEYKLGRANVVADTLNRKAELAAIAASSPQNTFIDQIKEGLKQDKLIENLMKLAKEGKT